MTAWILRRTLVMLLTLVGFSIALFVVMRMAPADPVDILFQKPQGRVISTEDLARLKEAKRTALGLYQPLPVQYLAWVREIVINGNLGYSIVNQRPAGALILERLPATLLLMGTSMVVAFAVGIPLGIIAAVHRNRPLDYILSAAALSAVAVPAFFLGIAAVYVFAVELRWFPSGGFSTPGEPVEILDVAHHMVLPVAVLGLSLAGPIVRYVRTSMLETFGREYLVAARAKGAQSRSVLMGHAFPNALLPIITIVGLWFGGLAAGAFVIEQIFSWPGMGQLALPAMENRDYAVIQAYAMLTGVMVLVGNFLADIGYAVADPRIRLE